MIIAFKNFYRNKMVNLSALSIRHFLPNIQIYCFTLYKYDTGEYQSQEPLLPFITEIISPTKYVGTNSNYDDKDTTKTSGYDNPDNGAYFIEGYNLIFDYFQEVNDKILMLSEDHFFTTGETLKELLNNDWDVAYGDAASEINGYLRGNGSILGINPSKVGYLFPMPEYTKTTVEWIIGNFLLRQLELKQLHSISTRNWLDYCGDGMYTNSSEDMINMMKEAGII